MLYPKSREHWLELRSTCISSTESAALFGMSPYMTPFELAVIKKKPEDHRDEYEQNERMTWGLRLQRAIAQGIAVDYGVKIRAVSGYAILEDLDIGASFDYEIIGCKDASDEDQSPLTCDQTLRELYREKGPGVLEIKNVDGFVFKNEWTVNDDKSIEAPAHIELQVQHQLLCIEREWAAIGVLVGGNRQVLIERLRDRDVGERIKAKAAKFWKGIAGGHMPPITMPEDADIIRALYKFAEPGKLIDRQKLEGAELEQDELHRLAKAHAEATAEKSAAEAKHKETGARLLMMMNDAEKALYPDLSINAGVVGPTRVEAYDRAGYRNLRVYTKKGKSK